MNASAKGTLYGIGVGPGDPELITLKGFRLLQSASLVVYPATETGESLALEIARPHIASDMPTFGIRIPMRTEVFPAQKIYDEASKNILEVLETGRDVAVLCEGDPFFYGSFMYLHDRLKEHCSCIIVPGVSSLVACAARIARPLSGRNDVLSVIPATLKNAELEAALRGCDSCAIIKIGRHFHKVKSAVERLGLMSHAMLVERATHDKELVRPLCEVHDKNVPYFSTLLIYNGTLSWKS